MKNKRIDTRVDDELLDAFKKAMKVMQDEDMSKVIRTLMREYINASIRRADDTRVISAYQALNWADAMGGELSSEQQQRLDLLRKMMREIQEKKDNGDITFTD